MPVLNQKTVNFTGSSLRKMFCSCFDDISVSLRRHSGTLKDMGIFKQVSQLFLTTGLENVF